MGIVGTPMGSSEYVPVWKQEVRNERGGKRLHGAFTGGFSAGYFNTVGSKEGWKPSQFKSSKGAPAERQSSSTYMDDEDIRDLEESVVLEVKHPYRSKDTNLEMSLLSCLGISISQLKDKVVSVHLIHMETIPGFTEFEDFSTNSKPNAILRPLNFEPIGLAKYGGGTSQVKQEKGQQNRSRTMISFTDADEEEEEEELENPTLSKVEAQAALRGFIPFGDIPTKQSQYLEFLKYHSGEDKNVPSIDPQWKQEFLQAARMFRPLPEAMSTRFTRPSAEGPRTATQLESPKNLNEPKAKGMRHSIVWQPATLLCNRLGLSPLTIHPKPKLLEVSKTLISPPLKSSDHFKRPEKSLFSTIFGD